MFIFLYVINEDNVLFDFDFENFWDYEFNKKIINWLYIKNNV